MGPLLGGPFPARRWVRAAQRVLWPRRVRYPARSPGLVFSPRPAEGVAARFAEPRSRAEPLRCRRSRPGPVLKSRNKGAQAKSDTRGQGQGPGHLALPIPSGPGAGLRPSCIGVLCSPRLRRWHYVPWGHPETSELVGTLGPSGPPASSALWPLHRGPTLKDPHECAE